MAMQNPFRIFLSGNEAVALAAAHHNITRGTGYPGTPSSEILPALHSHGVAAEWAPNEKVAAEVALGVAFAGGRALVTMKHVGFNVAADPLFTAAYSGVSGALVIACADDPGLASSQNEQDTRSLAKAAGIPVVEPSDVQEAYDYTRIAFRISEKWGLPVILRLTTRVCHTGGIVSGTYQAEPPPVLAFTRPIEQSVMVPAHARPAHKVLRGKLAAIAQWNNEEGPFKVYGPSDATLAIVTSGVSSLHAQEAAPDAAILSLGLTYPLPMDRIRAFTKDRKRILAVEENDPYLSESLRAAGIPAETNPESFRHGELNVVRVRRLIAGQPEPDAPPPRAKPPALCKGCPHTQVFGLLRDVDAIVAGDIGCYTLGALPPLRALHTQLCMGASIGMGLGLRHTLPEKEARKVVSVIGDSTFLHTGINGLIEMAYNPPPTGHIILVLDNGTTAMTGQQENPGTGRNIDHNPARRILIEDLARACGIEDVRVFHPTREADALRTALAEACEDDRLHFFVARQPCVLISGRGRSQKTETANCPTPASE